MSLWRGCSSWNMDRVFLSLHGGSVFTDAGLLVPVSVLPVFSGNLGFLTLWKCIFPFTLGEM